MSAGVLNGIIFRSVFIVLPINIGPNNTMNDANKNRDPRSETIPHPYT